MENKEMETASLSFEDFKKSILTDYRITFESREASLLGRKEVLTGKAKFGIFGDGKELPQLAMAKAFHKGDFRSGYYRDQTFMFATGTATIEEFFAQLYSYTDVKAEPHSAGRGMNAHFGTRSLDENGKWKNLMEIKNSISDCSPLASQMTRGVGLALASKLYRESKTLADFKQFSEGGNEVCFCTIGDSSTSEGIFWESVNAVGVQKIPMAISIWDDGYGISVPKELQTTKGNISQVLEGFRVNEKGEGFDIYVLKGWDYPSLCEAYQQGIEKIRKTHIPAIFHIQECTQPQGHSTSGSHERYKNKDRLEWEKEFDGIKRMREWMLSSALATEEELTKIETEAKEFVRQAQKKSWADYLNPIKNEIAGLVEIFDSIINESSHSEEIQKIKNELITIKEPFRRDAMKSAKTILRIIRDENISSRQKLIDWKNNFASENKERYNTFLHSNSDESALKIQETKAIYKDDSPLVNGFEVLNACFDNMLKRDPRVFAFGEDVGKIGDVNQGFSGLQTKYGELRVFDTGIREATIIGQGIGMAMRGLRPIAEIQYLDYLIYGLQPLVDEVTTLQYRTKGGNKCPIIVRTRGHRLEGIWHTGSPIGMILNALRGMYLLVPRNMTQAAGFYNTMLLSDEPALLIECLNGYRLKEKLPANIGKFTVPLGVPEILQEGNDVTIVTYGSCCRIAMEAMEMLNSVGISVELIDVQTLLPFDIHHTIVQSLKKTNRVVFFDEDVPGGASAYMLQQVLEKQNGYQYLDSPPKTVTAVPHRVAYASDGDYFCKPNAEDVFETVYEMMNETEPERFPKFY